jgi:hypothetical protein
LIDRKLLLQGAESSKFAFSEAALDQVILQTPEFQVDGKFSPSVSIRLFVSSATAVCNSVRCWPRKC